MNNAYAESRKLGIMQQAIHRVSSIRYDRNVSKFSIFDWSIWYYFSIWRYVLSGHFLWIHPKQKKKAPRVESRLPTAGVKRKAGTTSNRSTPAVITGLEVSEVVWMPYPPHLYFCLVTNIHRVSCHIHIHIGINFNWLCIAPSPSRNNGWPSTQRTLQSIWQNERQWA